jgi:hypothetical protein
MTEGATMGAGTVAEDIVAGDTVGGMIAEGEDTVADVIVEAVLVHRASDVLIVWVSDSICFS